MKKEKTLFLLLFLSVLGCATNTDIDNKFTVLKIQTAEKDSPDNSNIDLSKVVAPDDSTGTIVNNEVQKEKKAYFDYLPPEDTANNEGNITVIFKNKDKVRFDKNQKKLKSYSNVNLSEFEAVLNKHNMKSGFDLGSMISADDNKLDKMQEDYYKKNEVDIPHLRSIHYYQLDKDTDIKTLCKDLMRLPYVRLAYPTPKVVTTHEVPIPNASSIPLNNYPTIPNPDPSTNGGYSNHYWFDQHDVVRGQNYFNFSGVTKPTLGVIDTGFDQFSPELNLLPGFYIEMFPVVKKVEGPVDCPNNSCVQETNTTSAHGNSVAYVAAAKKNGSYGEGILPGANILPVKVQSGILFSSYTAGISYALGETYTNYPVDAINISLALDNPLNGTQYPLSFDTTINIGISYAYNAGKPVIITAGNKNQALIPPSSSYFSDAVVVGGSMPETYPNNNYRYIRWVSPYNTSEGSNYTDRTLNFPNAIDISAGSYRLKYLDFNPYTFTRSYVEGNGTSLAAPLVSITMAAMKKINPSLNARQIKDIVINATKLRKYDTSGSTNKILGENLENSFYNKNYLVGIRDLDMYSSLVIAKEITNPNYIALARVYNTDNLGMLDQAISSGSFPGYSATSIGEDKLWGITSAGGNYINYADYNFTLDCNYGFQVYRNPLINPLYTDKINMVDQMGGVVGAVGIPVATSYNPTGCYENSWNYKMSYQY